MSRTPDRKYSQSWPKLLSYSTKTTLRLDNTQGPSVSWCSFSCWSIASEKVYACWSISDRVEMFLNTQSVFFWYSCRLWLDAQSWTEIVRCVQHTKSLITDDSVQCVMHKQKQEKHCAVRNAPKSWWQTTSFCVSYTNKHKYIRTYTHSYRQKQTNTHITLCFAQRINPAQKHLLCCVRHNQTHNRHRAICDAPIKRNTFWCRLWCTKTYRFVFCQANTNFHGDSFMASFILAAAWILNITVLISHLSIAIQYRYTILVPNGFFYAPSSPPILHPFLTCPLPLSPRQLPPLQSVSLSHTYTLPLPLLPTILSLAYMCGWLHMAQRQGFIRKEHARTSFPVSTHTISVKHHRRTFASMAYLAWRDQVNTANPVTHVQSKQTSCIKHFCC